MHASKKRRAVTPVKEQNPSTLFQEHVIQQTGAQNVLVAEYDIVDKQRPIPFWKRDLKLPRWLLALLVSLAIILFTAFALFAAVVTLKKASNGEPCKTNSDCQQDLGLMCNNYRCGCAYSHFWSTSYSICERSRMINRTCVNNTECDSLGNLQCSNGTGGTSTMQPQCQCILGMFWLINTCTTQQLYNGICTVDANCDSTRFLYCDLIGGMVCHCNTTMFWNGNNGSGTCEYKRTVNQYCYPYDNTWCDYSGPIGQHLTCASYVNPYGSEYGVCECGSTEYYNGTAALANGFCVPMLGYNQSCSYTAQCDYRVNLTCSNNLCLCPSGTNYNPAVGSPSTGVGHCDLASGYMQNCTAILLCSASQNLFCDYSVYGGANTTGICLCNSSWSFWDGLTCASKLSIGGQCSINTQCLASSGLFCSNYTQSLGQCDCDKSYFWNSTCSLKQYYNTTCSSSYVCDDNRGLQCQGLGGSLFQKCDCYNTTYMWDSLYRNQTFSCIVKIGFNSSSTCYGNLECQDFNYLICTNGTCLCAYTDYWDGSRCQPKRNYTDLCNATYMCRDFSPVNLICRYGSTVPSALQCLCNTTSFWEQCQQACVVSKQRQQPCTLVGNCTSNECDVTKNLQCINDSVSNVTTGGWCNCTSLQWWNGTYCRNKGTPAWGTNSSALCNATYQCADYNLVSCPLGSSSVANLATCECATTKYWNGVTCLDRGVVGASCTSWSTSAYNTTTCLSAAGAGLLCTGASNLGNGSSINGNCACPSGYNWNSTFLLCITSSGR